MTASDQVHSLDQAAAHALKQARASEHGRGTTVLWTGRWQRLVVIGLTAGAELGEHASPAAASLQVLFGTAVLVAGERRWPVSQGEIVAIPPDRHSLHAETDCAVLLTVSLT